MLTLQLLYQNDSPPTQSFGNFDWHIRELRVDFILTQGIILKWLNGLTGVNAAGKDVMEIELAGKDIHHDMDSICIWSFSRLLISVSLHTLRI